MKADEIVRKTINEHNLICQGDVLILGLSGGPDSLCLLHILLGLRRDFGFVLCALHFNHCVRGEESDADEAFLRDYCAELGVPLKVVREDIPALAGALGQSVEECGRKRRQQALADYAEELSALWNGHPERLPEDAPQVCRKNAADYEVHPCAVLAHNADDQAETVLLRILRGTGVHGLAAMEYLREDGLIRPLLDTPRAAVEEYCRDRNLQPRMDKTNASADYLRNRVRLEILPRLAEINPNIKKCLTRLAANAAADDAYLQQEAESWLSQHERKASSRAAGDRAFADFKTAGNPETPTLLIRDLRGMAPAIFQRVVKLEFAKIGLTEDIGAVHINALERAIYTNVGNKTIEFPANYCAYINHGEVVFRKK